MGIWGYKKRKARSRVKEAFFADGGYKVAASRGRLTEVESIDIGHGNKGIYIVDYRPAEAGDGIMPFRMIKKHSASSLEFKFSQWLLHNANSLGVSILPEIYDCFEEGDDKVIVLEYLPGAGADVVLSEERAKVLARVVEQFNRLFTQDTAPEFVSRKCSVTSKSLNIGCLKRIFKAARASFSEESFEQDAAMRKLLSLTHSQVFTHGDLGLPNVYIQGRENRSVSMKVFDFSHVCFMTPGAEFYHFARGSMRGGKDKEFFNSLCAAYAKRCGFLLPAVRLAAFLYALDRQITRTRKNLERMSEKKVKFDLKIILELYSEAMISYETLDNTPGGR